MHDAFAGKHIVVTGATGGLGTSVVETLLSRGAICHLPCIESALPDHVSWRNHERAHVTLNVNIGGEAQAERFYGALPDLWAAAHLVGGFAMAGISDISLADYRNMMALNSETCFLCSREAVRAMRKHSTSGGRIVNVAARPVLEPTAGMLAYASSKAAVAALTRCLAAEVRDEDILVNAIVPSIIDTPTNRSAMPDADFSAWPKPSEIAETITHLLSPGNTLTSGALVPVYGRF